MIAISPLAVTPVASTQNFGVHIAVVVADNLTFTDASNWVFGKSITDSFAFGDSVMLSIGAGFQLVVGDILTFTDGGIPVVLNKSVVDGLLFTDDHGKNFGRSATDTITFSEHVLAPIPDEDDLSWIETNAKNIVKHPSESRRYRINFRRLPEMLRGERVSSVTITRTSLAGSNTLLVGSVESVGTGVQFRLGGGADGDEYEIEAEATTTGNNLVVGCVDVKVKVPF